MDGVRVQKNSFETSLFVVYPPKSMCKGSPAYYTSAVDGREVKRPRYVARDYEEAKKYPEESMRWLAENFIPGGIDAVAGGDMNFDESTPHIQFQADTLSPPIRTSPVRCVAALASRTTQTPRCGTKTTRRRASRYRANRSSSMHSEGFVNTCTRWVIRSSWKSLNDTTSR